jgi:UDP-GlcNAc:undecaprenyl-phosphate GlcNAc-1-phosphate transferase
LISAPLSFLVACLVAALMTPLIVRLGTRARLVDETGGLKVHERPVPRVGGIAIACGFFAPLMLVFALGADVTTFFEPEPKKLVAFLTGAVVIFLLGVVDDVRGLGAPAKFAVQLAVAAGTWAAGFRIDHVRLPFLGPTELGSFGLVVTMLWIVGLTNALNFVDGLDGLAAGVAFFAATAHVVVGVLNDDQILVLFSAALAGAVLGFLPHNFHPARLFMGDSGSLFLGYVLAVTSIYGASHKASTALALLGPILILGLPILDTSLAILRRTLRGQPVFDGDREHLHHRMLSLGLSQRRSVVLLWGVAAAFTLAGLLATSEQGRPTAIVLLCLLAMLVVFERRLGLLRGGAAAERTMHPAAEAAREMRRLLAQAGDPTAAFDALVSRAVELGIHRIELRAGTAPPLTWERPSEARVRREGSVRLEAHAGDLRLVVEKRPFRRSAGLPDDLLSLLLEASLEDLATRASAVDRR